MKNLSFSLLSLSLFIFACIPTAISDPLIDVCKLVNCGQGTCKASGASFLGFECECGTGWTKLKIGEVVVFPACIMPNCTLDFKCGSKPPPPTILPLPPISLSNPCSLVWCGDGNCVANGTSLHTCQCNQGSGNLMNSPGLPCFEECFLGADCNGIVLGQPTGASPPAPPPPHSSASSRSGRIEAWRRATINGAFSMIIATAILLW